METMRLTLWEGFAHDQGRFLFYELNQDHVLGASMVSVGSYYGKISFLKLSNHRKTMVSFLLLSLL